MFHAVRARKPGRLAMLTLAGLAACSGCDGGSAPPPPTTGTVVLQLDHAVGNDSLRLHVERYTNAAGNFYEVYELRYYVSDAELVRTDGSRVQVGDYHYRDFEVASTRDWTFGNVPNGTYRAIRFTFGLNAQRNVTGGLPVSFENSLMAWPEPLGGGYHFMQLDGLYHGGTDGWQAHVGRLQLHPDSMVVDPHFEVQLDLAPAVVVAGDAWTVQVEMDVNAWFASPNVFDFDVFGGAVMNNPVAQRQLGENGVHVFSAQGVSRAP